jgi:hypothetical protein
MSNIKLKSIAVVVKADDGNVYQVMLDKTERDLVENLIYNLHMGTIKVLDGPIDTIDLKENSEK